MVTDELVESALKLVAERGGNYEYFFAKLTIPDWIPPLQKRGRFSHPPPAIIDANYIRFPRWPEGEYLSRMASVASDVVFAAIDSATYESDNEYVHQVLLEIAVGLTPDLAAKVARAEAKWALKQVRFRSLYDERLTQVVVKLATEGHSDAALQLLTPILRLDPAPKRTPELMIEGRPFRGSGEPIGRIDAWHIQRMLHLVSKPLAESVPENFLRLLSETLHHAVRIHDNERHSADDYSTIWRPRIQSDRFGDVLDVLVTATKDAAVQIAREGNYQLVSEVFAEYAWPIFRRLEYYALGEADDLPNNVINSIVLQKDLYKNSNDNPEFNDFLSKVSLKLEADTREKVLAIIDEGPNLSDYSNFLDSQGEKRQESESWITDQWRLGWLSAYANIIGEERSRTLDGLIEKYGAPRPRFSSGAFAVGHVAAIKLEEFRKFLLPDAVNYLKKWTPGPDTHPEMPSRSGLGQILQSWVSEEPSLFSDNLQLFQTFDLHPTYLRSIIDGFTSQLKSERQFDPYKIVAAIEWMLLSTNKIGTEPYNWNEDPGWSWAHMSSARFLSELFLHEKRLDTTRYLEFWPALQLISENPSPTEEDEADYRKKEDISLLALNSTRPVGLEAVMRYARWLKSCASDLKVDSIGLPQVFALLASHLDAEVDKSVAVREMYGMQFALLVWLDQKWLESQLPNLFPEKPLRILDRFAWNAYLQFSRAISTMLPAMRFRYKRAVNALQTGETKVSDSERSLGNHLTLYYSWGTIEHDDELLTLFFQKASPALKSQTIGDVGWQLGQQTENLDSKIRQRLMAFWEDRFAQGMAQINDSRKELEGFGWWFACKKFPDDWSIKQLVIVLDTFRSINPDFAVVERLASFASVYPFEAVHCLGIIFEEDRDGWAIHGWSDNPQIIVREALKGDSKSRLEAERVVNLLVARGQHGFRQLLKQQI